MKVYVPADGAYAVDTASFKLVGVEPDGPESAAAGASAGMDPADALAVGVQVSGR